MMFFGSATAAGDGSTDTDGSGDGEGVGFGGVYCSISSGVPIVSDGSLRRRSSSALSLIDSGSSCCDKFIEADRFDVFEVSVGCQS